GGGERAASSRQIPCRGRRSDRKAGGRRALRRGDAELPGSHRHCASRSSRDGGARLRRVALTQYHLISYWTRIFPNHFALVPVSGAERFFVKIAFGRVVDPLRPRALTAFEEFFFSRAREVYPRYDFARMNDDEYAAPLGLD